MAVKIGFIGTGGIANAHMSALAGMDDVELKAFMDIREDRAEEAAHKHRGRAYSDHNAMLDSEELDAVYVCVPPFAHTGQELAVVRRGLALFVEKPVALSMAHAREIEAAIDEAGVISSVGYHWRYYDTTEAATVALAGKSVGMTLGYWMGGMPGVHWWRVKAESGGQMVEQTTHICDLSRLFAGEVDTIYAAMALRALGNVEALDVPDVGAAVLRYESGAIGAIHNTCVLSQGYTVGIHIIAHDLVVQQTGGLLKIITPDEVHEHHPRVNPTIAINAAFVEAVRTGERENIRSPYSDSVKTLAISLAANKSDETGEPVRIADL